MRDVSTKPKIARTGLLDLIHSRPEPVVVLEAAAGMGKSTLLAKIAERSGSFVHFGGTAPDIQNDVPTLWDLPPDAEPEPLPERFVCGAARIVIAKRGETELPGLARARAYGNCATFGTGELLFKRDELAEYYAAEALDCLMAETGGWPLLVSRFGNQDKDDEMMRRFLIADILRPLSASALVHLKALMAGAPMPTAIDLPLPFARRDQAGHLGFAIEAIRGPLTAALETVLNERLGKPAEGTAIAQAYTNLGQVMEAILTFQQAGFHDLALRAFVAADGYYFIYTYGPEAFDRVLAGFPNSFAMGSDVLVMSLTLRALKRGDTALARRLLADRFGDAVHDFDAVFSPRSIFSLNVRVFRHLMMTWEDVYFTDEQLERVFGLLPELPAEAHFQRGGFYNSVLDFYIRSRRFAEAEDVALRARDHYEQARSPMLTFYIVLHQAIMRLMMGDAITARKHATDAAQCLRRVSFDSPSDARLLRLLNACVEYESGKAESLARFLSLELDEFAHGEIWPSLIEFALRYGSQALSEHFSTIAARSFLDRWRVYQIRNRQFRTMIEIREAAVLQNGNRWQEAAEKLSAIASYIDKAWIQAARDDLIRLADRDDIGLALIWLRQLVYEAPTRPALEAQLNLISGNLHLTERQRIGIDIWLAFIYKRQRNLSKARALLQKIFERVARLGAVAPLTEERVFLAEMVGHQRISEFLDAVGSVRQTMRRLRESGLPSPGIASTSGLTRREGRILLMISEGAANKFIANALGLSEATVKFHLGNLYRKLGCKKRREAISAARALGMVR